MQLRCLYPCPVPPVQPSEPASTQPPGVQPGPVRLANLTTLRLGGPAPRLIVAATAEQVAQVIGEADRSDTPVLVLGGGSNLVVADAGIAYPVVKISVPGLSVRADDNGATITVGAGENWDGVVAELTAAGYSGIESLSGIPGQAGATPVQNVGAYGTEISDLLVSVTAYDRGAGRLRRIAAADLALDYRSSALRGTDRAVVTDVTLRLRRGPSPVRYAELARALGVQVGQGAPAGAVREAVLALRAAKGMVLDPADPDTCSAGSFFTNPILSGPELAQALQAIHSRLGDDVRCPQYPAGTSTKLSAAWLIERAGFGKGFAGPGGRVAVSAKHTLALTNRGTGSTADLLVLARQIRDGVRDAFTVTLEPEPVLVGVSLGVPGRP